MLKYQQAEQKFQELIADLGPGKALPPVRELISKSGFSQATVMKAISALEKRGLLERRRGAGIFTIHSGGRFSDAVAVMLSKIDNGTSSQILKGIQLALARRGNQVQLFSFGEQVNKILPALKNNGIQQLILYPNTPDLNNMDFLDFVEQLGKLEMQIATIEVPVPGLKCVFVGQENTKAFEEVTEYLLRQGIRSIAVTGMFNGVIYTSRLAGIRNAIAEKNPSVRLKQIDESGGEDAEMIAKQLLAARCEAILLCNSESSRDIARELRIHGGSNPDRLRVAGVVEQGDRIPFPNAISLEKQNIELGAAAVKALFSAKQMTRYLPIKVHYP